MSRRNLDVNSPGQEISPEGSITNVCDEQMETGENNRLINLPRETLNERILNILEELGQLDLEHFQWQLRQRVNLEGHDAIPKSRLENASTIATTDLIMQTYTNDAAQIMVNILNKIKRNDLLEKSPLMVPPFEMLHLPQPQTKKDLLKRCLHVYACVCVCLFVCVSVSVCVYMFVFAGNSTSSTPVPKNDVSDVPDNSGNSSASTAEPKKACGVPAIKPVVSGRPMGGGLGKEEAVAHSWPWQVSLQENTGWHSCGGSLINKNWVVTAAQCKVSTLHRAILGQHNLKHTNIQRMRIGKVFNHPEFNAETLDYDIALIKLQSPAQMNNHVSPVCVAETRDNFYAGMKCVATGWGRTRYEPPERPLELQQICVPLISNRKCNSYFKPLTITIRMLCAGGAGASTCHGDSGGPLVCEKNGAWTLVGVTAFVRPGCPTNMPGGYSSITALRAWMDQIMADN